MAMGILWAAALLAGGAARGDDQAWRELRGQVVVSDVLLASTFDSDRELVATLHRVRCSTVTAIYGFWRLHLVAFLDPAAEDGTETAVVVARDVTAADPKERKGARQGGGAVVKLFEVQVQPGQRILQLNDFVLVETMGFQRGHDYELTVETSRAAEVAAGGKRDVNARGVVTLR